MAMAAGEYVSVSSQADSEAADLAREQRALNEQPNEEKVELAHIYEERGLKPRLARQVARQLMAKDALAAHARDELGFAESAGAKPTSAAVASANRLLGRRRDADAGGVSCPTKRGRHYRSGGRVGLPRRARRARGLGGRSAGCQAFAPSGIWGALAWSLKRLFPV